LIGRLADQPWQHVLVVERQFLPEVPADPVEQIARRYGISSVVERRDRNDLALAERKTGG